jgi:hypothetical protein
MSIHFALGESAMKTILSAAAALMFIAAPAFADCASDVKAAEKAVMEVKDMKQKEMATKDLEMAKKAMMEKKDAECMKSAEMAKKNAMMKK